MSSLFSFQSLFNPNSDKTVIFVDDSEENVKSAITRGMIGIHYKNALELEKTFLDLGLTVFLDD